MEAAPTRPLGVTIVAILIGLSALVSVVFAFLSLVILGPFGLFGFAMNCLFALMFFYVAYSFWSLQTWAWTAALFIEIINGVYSFFVALILPRGGLFWLATVVSVAVIVYLNTPAIRQAFGVDEAPDR
jgi:hypothetical protein